MKLLYITDSHFRESRPVGRKDDYLESLIEKHEEFAQMCCRLKPDQIWHGGDLFDGPQHSIYLVRKVRDVINASLHYKGAPLKWHVLVGSHLWRGSWDTWREKSGLTMLYEMGLVEIHEDGHIARFTHDHLVGMRHEQMVDKDVPWEHTRYEDYDWHPNVFLVSDYHPFQDYKAVKTKTGKVVHFIAPGSIARKARIESNHRPPRAAYIVFDQGKMTVKFLKFKSAKPPEEIFTEKENTTESDERRQEFDEAVGLLKKLSGDVKEYRIEDTVRIVAKRAKVKEEVRDLCLERVRD